MVIIMLGAPGTGKGTVAGILQEKLGIKQVSTGDIFRKAIKEKTPLGNEVAGYMEKGLLVPDEVVIKVVDERLNQPDLENGVILDGFPRTKEQAIKLEKMLAKNNKKVDMAINLITPEEEIIERISNRRVCTNQECKAVFNVTMNPPKQDGICDKCGSALIQRKDDTKETIKNRLKAYYETSEPIVEFYKEKNVLYSSEVSTKINKLAEDVAKEVVEIIKK